MTSGMNIRRAVILWSQSVMKHLTGIPLVAIGFVNAIVVVVSLVTSLILVRSLPKENYGQLVFFYAGFGLLRLLMNLGLGLSVNRDISAAEQETARLQTIFYSMLLSRLGSIIIILTTIPLFMIIATRPFLQYIVFAAVTASLADFFHAVIAGSRNTRHIAMMTGVQPFSYALLIIVLMILRRTAPEILMFYFGISFMLMLLLGVTLVVKSGLLHLPTRSDFSIQYMRQSIGFVIPVYGATLLSQVWTSAATGVLGWLGLFQASAEFGVVFNMISIPVSVSSPTLMTTFLPQISHLYSTGKQDAIQEQIKNAVRLFTSVYVWGAILLFSFSEIILGILFGQSYVATAPYLTLLSPAPLILSALPIFTLSLVAVGRPWYSLIGLSAQLSVLLGSIFLAGNAITIGLLCWAVLLSGVAGLVVQWFLARRVLRMSLLPTRTFQLVIVGLLFALGLRLLVTSLGVIPSLWHVVIGVLFTLVYWVMVSSKHVWRPALI